MGWWERRREKNLLERILAEARSLDWGKAEAAIQKLPQYAADPQAVDVLLELSRPDYHQLRELPVTPTFEFSAGVHLSSTIKALGQIGQQRTIDRLIDIATSLGNYAQKAVDALGNPRNHAAVDRMVRELIPKERTRFSQSERSTLLSLKGAFVRIQTPASLAAAADVEFITDLAFLLEHWDAQKSAGPLVYKKEADALALLSDILAAPAGDKESPKNLILALVAKEPVERIQAIRARLAEADLTALHLHMIELAGTDRLVSSVLLRLLPNPAPERALTRLVAQMALRAQSDPRAWVRWLTGVIRLMYPDPRPWLETERAVAAACVAAFAAAAPSGLMASDYNDLAISSYKVYVDCVADLISHHPGASLTREVIDEAQTPDLWGGGPVEGDLSAIHSLQASRDPAVRALTDEFLTNVRERTRKLKSQASEKKAVPLPD